MIQNKQWSFLNFCLQISHLTHSVLSQNGFKAEYKKPGGMPFACNVGDFQKLPRLNETRKISLILYNSSGQMTGRH